MQARSALFAFAAALAACTPLLHAARSQAATIDPVPQVLEGHRWTLESATDGQGRRLELAPAGSPPFVFRFADSRLAVQGGCNQLMGSFRIDAAGQLDVGKLASTMKACAAPLMQADATMAALLASPLRIEIADGGQPRLRLTAAASEMLALVGQPTPEMLYGAGTRIFLEVAPRRVACVNPLTGEKACLQVRERRYDEQGLRVGTPGEWQLLYEPIEGFVHVDGERRVLRLMRYQRSPVPPGGSATVYVLDLVVETELVKP